MGKTMMGKSTVVVVILSAFALAGCGNKQDANEKNFGMAIAQHLDKNGELCLVAEKWPVDVPKEGHSSTQASQMEALKAIGLVSGVDGVYEVTNVIGITRPNVSARRYELTSTGKQFSREKELEQFNATTYERKKVMGREICFGKVSLDKIVKWEGPMKFGDYQVADVFYLYKIDGLADWAKKPEFRETYPDQANFIDGVGKLKARIGVQLTNLGWDVPELRR
jgi:hypothetical protein